MEQWNVQQMVHLISSNLVLKLSRKKSLVLHLAHVERLLRIQYKQASKRNFSASVCTKTAVQSSMEFNPLQER